MSNGNGGTAVAKRESKSALDTFIEKMKPKAMQALADKMDPDAFMLGIETAIRKTPRLLQCTQSSLFVAIATCAEAGLVPLYDLAYLIPRYNKRENEYEAHFQFGYKGLIELLLASGRVAGVDSELVREHDEFGVRRGLHPDIIHVPTLTVEERLITHVYAIAWPTDRNARPWFEVMTRDQVEHIRKVSADEKSRAWKNHWGQMARKTAIRRLCNYIPLRAQDRQLLEKDDDAAFAFDDAGEYEPIQGESRTERVEALISGDDDDPDDLDLEGDMLDLPDVNGEHSITDLEEMAGFAKADREALCERLGIKSPVHDVDKYADAVRAIVAERQEAEG